MKKIYIVLITLLSFIMSGYAQRIATGYHSLLVKNDGTLWAWGYNYYGQIGDGTSGSSNNKTAPVKVLDNVAQVAAGDYHSLAVKSDGSLWAWGYNYNGQIGDGTSGSSNNKTAPVKVLDNVAQVAAGGSHTLAIKTDGTLWAWGYNYYGQIGDGTSGSSTNKTSPVKIMDNVAQVAAGDSHTLAVKTDGSVWAWGNNNSGQLGDGTSASKTTPVKIMDGGVEKVAAGSSNSYFLMTDGRLLACGNNDYVGQLQTGTTWAVFNPVEIMQDVAQVAAKNNNAICIKTDGRVMAWGDNRYRQLLGESYEKHLTPIRVPVSGNIASIEAGNNSSQAVTTNGDLYGWGRNNNGQIGQGDRFSKTNPSLITSSVSQAVIGYDNAAAVKTNNTLWEWGVNCRNLNTMRSLPIQTMTGITQIAAGYRNLFAVKADGSLWAWGYNPSGQLGDGTTADKTAPVKVLDNVAQVAAGDDYTLAIKTDGSLWAWGNNYYGQLGDGTTADKTTPVKIMDNVAQVAAGYGHTLAIKTDGSLWAWGYNSWGQIGDGTSGSSNNKTAPVKVLDNVAQAAAGDYHSLAVKSDGSLWAWGDNFRGQIGDGTTADKTTPVKIMDNVAQVAAGTYHTLAIKTDGTLWAWGYNYFGNLGLGTKGYSEDPVLIMTDYLEPIEYDTDSVTYVLNPNNHTATIFVVKPTYDDLVISDNVTYNGQSYTITALSEQAMASDNGFNTSVSFPATITTVADGAFDNAMATAIIWNSETPLPAGAFSKVDMDIWKNMLLYVNKDGIAPSGFANTIVNGIAQNIVLEEGYVFHCPQQFTARAISFTHEFSMSTIIGKQQGWETIALPFDVMSISHASKGNLIPFASYSPSSNYKPFWLYEWTRQGFVKASTMQANVPYLISMPNNSAYSSVYNVAGSITFSATNAIVKTTRDEDLQSYEYNNKYFWAQYYYNSGSDNANINSVNNLHSSTGGYDPGSIFVKNLRNTFPFEGYMWENTTNNAKDVIEIEFAYGELTGIEEITESIPFMEGIFTLSGLRISIPDDITEEDALKKLSPGVYIVNGKKKVVK